jgi:hypothetical protein
MIEAYRHLFKLLFIETCILDGDSMFIWYFSTLLGAKIRECFISQLLFVWSLHNVYKMNAYRADHVCPHVSALEPLDRFGWNLVQYAIGGYPPTIGNANMAHKQTCEVGSALAPLIIGSYKDVQYNRFSKNTQLRCSNSLYNVKRLHEK